MSHYKGAYQGQNKLTYTGSYKQYIHELGCPHCPEIYVIYLYRLMPVLFRESLAFATEPVLCSLANILGQHDNLPPPALAALKDYTFFDVEIKYGLLQVCDVYM